MSDEVPDAWQDAWRPLMESVGTQLGGTDITWGADAVEAGTLRRWLEPLEFDCTLHRDKDAAVAQGWNDVIAPYSSLLTFAIPATWDPSRPVFADPGLNAQPLHSPITTPVLPKAPPTTGFFATDLQLDFVRPPMIGDRIGIRGFRLVSCTPKQTTVGRGAFITWESEVVDGAGALLARQRTSAYAYVPAGDQDGGQ